MYALIAHASGLRKKLRRKVKELCDGDGMPILPRNCDWRMERGKYWFGGSSHDRRACQFRIIGGKLVSTRDEPEPFPGYTQRQFRHYRCKQENMITINGQYAAATVYTDALEKGAIGQLTALCNLPFAEGSRLRIMPDAHAGAGCVVGTTMTVTDKIVPNLVGVDIACGMEVIRLGPCRMDFPRLDRVIRQSVPSGFSLRQKVHRFAEEWDISKLSCAASLQKDKALKSIGTLGGGNHFIEIAQDGSKGDFYLIIHSGSRNPGLQVAAHHQKLAGENRESGIPYELAYLGGSMFAAYVHDMEVMQEFADLNRKAIADEILKGMRWKPKESFTTVHNYLDTQTMILRKGAVSAQKGERLLIPMNMRDGSLLCEGLGNPDWNYSAPHGAGRICSRSEAKSRFTLTRFKQDMKGIFSSCISRNTIDESPQAYKPMQEILANIGDTVRVLSILKPVYNFKAGGE